MRYWIASLLLCSVVTGYSQASTEPPVEVTVVGDEDVVNTQLHKNEKPNSDENCGCGRKPKA